MRLALVSREPRLSFVQINKPIIDLGVPGELGYVDGHFSRAERPMDGLSG